MKNKLVIVLLVVMCLLCTGCKKDVVQKQTSIIEKYTDLSNTDDLENDYDYIDGITDPVRIEEYEDELRVNVRGNVTSIYKCSGDVVTEWYEKYYFETEELADEFATSQENSDNISVSGKVVLIKLNIPEGTVMKKSDLVETYSMLKDVYENE